MRKFFFYLTILLFSSSLFAANRCDFQGHNNFTIEVIVTGKPTPQEIYVTNFGYKKTEVLWYTGSASDSGLNYIFKEDQLINGLQYAIRIINDADNGILKYYKKPIGGSWNQPEIYYGYVHQGNIHVLSDNDDVSFSCQDGIKEPEVSPDLCKYFPEPAQSWKSGSSLNIQNSNSIITGWSAEYVSAYLSDGKLKTSYDIFSYQAGLPGACEVGSCIGGAPKVETPEPIDVSFDSKVNLSITAWNYTSNCTLAQNCQFSESNGTVYVDILGSLQSLNVEEYSSSDKHFVINFKPINNGTGPAIQSYISGGSVETIFHSGNYILGSVSFNGGTLKVHSDVILNLVTSLTQNNAVDTIDVGGKKDLIIYGPSASLVFSTPNIDFAAQILADRVTFSNPVTIRGAITANSLTMSTQNINIIGEGACLTGGNVEEDYTLELSPVLDVALVCEDLPITLSVMSDGSLASDFSGTASVTINGVEKEVALFGGKGNITLSSSGKSQSVSVNASLDGYSDVASVAGNYQFVPYKIAVDDQYVIANKPQTVSAKTLACSSGEVVDVGYNGALTAKLSAWVAPINGIGDLTYAPQFTEGGASSELTLDDSGQVTVTLEDSNFNCTGFDNCPIEGNDTLKGQFTVYSRPWTFAICSPNNTPMNGNISDASSAGFTSAGNAFALNVRPLRWVSTGNDSDPVSGSEAIETSSYCSSPVTQNFFIAGSELNSTVELTHTVAQPSGGADGTLSGTLALSNSEGVSNSYLPFSGLAWSEVGVLRVNADTQASYLGMNINQGYRDIGRFYPAWLSLISNSWNYSSNHNDFMYMGQPIAYDFVVEAQNMQGGATTNYSSFSPSLIADVKLLAVDTSDDNSEFGSRVEDYDLHFWDGSNQWSGAQLQVSDAPFQFNKLQTTSSPLITRADGPYEDGFGLRVTANSSGVKVDGVDFKTSEAPNLELNSSGITLDTGKPFSAQPDIRYGRMVLDDVGGTSTSTIYIPLRTEYWNGSRFIENEQDSGSTFVSLGGYVCQQTVWSGSGSTSSASLLGADSAVSVTNGVSNKLSAKPHSNMDASSLREQIRFWLRMSDTSPQLSEMNVSCGTSYTNQPWLQYNWRDRGDEDPSAVVTFGVYRGNDRIIFRGESGLTGQ
ncbi:MSHA biogenesis protein MshQ [Vibrio diazotrophicus]|uniref:DUF6701 domain-containing protein n=1 Tax=Vibrio diazotrophicus TaxID=685 RepID=UPI0022B0675E|nr:DUF6701 domain-containing protein [Vibrio diazotrophicus]MCZ4373850.1 MSHA biogenesis protein MshQ [Vibrio diazotrophicus]